MAANTYLQVSELDFEDIRSNLKTYLSTQTQFQDYNFEGSTIATLLDVLAYNTHYNAYYLNMVGNEMFLDTAQQRDSVVSRAKELGYTPVSSRGSSATINLLFNGANNAVASFTIPKNSTFTSTIDDLTYTYVTTEATKVVNSSNTFSTNVVIKEGTPLTHRFTVDASGTQRFILPNKNIDTSSIVVNVQASASDTTLTEFTKLTNIREVYTTSTVYSLFEAADEKYEIVFGDGVLGQAVKNGNIVIVDYLVNNGPVTNGADTFSVDTLNVGMTYSSATVTLVSKASGGHQAESIDSIKFNAPKNYQTQNRAVIDNDYERIILSEYGDIQSVVAFGGEEASPPVYGKVYIAVKPFGENFATDQRKTQIKEGISDRTPLAVDPVVIDADYTYLIPTITTYYDKTNSTKNDAQVEALIRTSVGSWATNNLERFGNRLRFSRFVRALDNTASEILNNDVNIKLQKRIVPDTQRQQKVELKYNNGLRTESLTSTQFTYNGFLSYLDDDGLGNVRIYRFNDAKQKVYISETAGTIDYTTGDVDILGFKPTAYADTELKITAEPSNLDVIPVREQVLLMESGDAIINVVGENS